MRRGLRRGQLGCAVSDIAMILAWQPADFEKAARSWRGAGRRLAEAADTIAEAFDGVPLTHLDGPIRREGEAAVVDRAGRLRRDAGALGRFADELDRACGRITLAQKNLARAIAEAEDDDFIVDRATGRVLSGGARATSIADVGGTARGLGHHRRNIAIQVEQALKADERSAAQLRAQFPAGAHLSTPGQPLGRVEGSAGLPPLQAAEVDRVRERWGYDVGRDVEVLDTAPGTTAVAVGDPRTAEHVITIVPGTSSTAEELAGHIERARWLHGPDVAVVAWTYDAPPGLVSAASSTYHERAATSLQMFQAQLADNPNAKLSVMGHSYGATVVAQATRGHGLHADAVVLVGSPGAGPGIRDVRDMRLNRRDGTPHHVSENGHRVVAVTSPDDPIRFAGASPVHGADVTTRWFGANRMDISDAVKAKGRNGWDLPGKLKSHTDDYFPDPDFRDRLEQKMSTIPGSGPGTGAATGTGTATGTETGTGHSSGSTTR